MNIWYGTDCRYPSTGWNAWDAKGVGTAASVNRCETKEPTTRTDPFVMGLVNGLIKHGIVQDTMEPVYEIVSECQEAGDVSA